MSIKIKRESEYKLKRHHPWILKSDILEVPSNFRDGKCTDFVSSRGEFLGFGYYNSKSKIAGRVLTFDSTQKFITQKEKIEEHLLKLWKERINLGFLGSFRLCYGESDFMPGLILDYYQLEQAQVIVIQVSTLGMELLFHDYFEILQGLCEQANKDHLTNFTWDQTALILRNDLQVRKYEGLEVELPRVLKTPRGIEFNDAAIFLNKADKKFIGKDSSFSTKDNSDKILMSCDLYQGQKTGFFLDQYENIVRVCIFLDEYLQSPEVKNEFLNRSFKVLDLCCYVGHWSTQISLIFRKHNINVEFSIMDVSQRALDFAQKNIQRQSHDVQVFAYKKNVLEDLKDFESDQFDLIIADPPAFIKAKKDVPTGQHAYLKLNTQAIRLAKDNGLVVSCSCSAHMSKEMLFEVFNKALTREKSKGDLILEGGHSADHPKRAEFPEAHYLKMFMHKIKKNRE